MTQYLVSRPQSLLLLSESHADMHETTLVVPDLPVVRLPYARCLVDAGPRFEEHAVALSEREVSPAERAIIVRSLTAARPTVVSVLWLGNERSPALHSTEIQSGSAAAATFLALDSDDMEDGAMRSVSLWLEGVLRESFAVTRHDRFFSVVRG